jgi:hypothetical protein
MPADNTFIATATGATTRALSLFRDQSVLISADALAGVEVVDIQVWNGASYDDSGDQLTATAPAKLLDGPGEYQLSKSVTASTCAVFKTP